MTSELNEYSLNYVVDIQVYNVPEGVPTNLDSRVKSVLGAKATIGGSTASTSSELIEELISGLSFVGDTGSYPNPKYVGSREHRDDLNTVKSKLKPLLINNPIVTRFLFKEGHPFYPVFWDFAFLVEAGVNQCLIIGSSSD